MNQVAVLPKEVPLTEQGITTHFQGLEVNVRDKYQQLISSKLTSKHLVVGAVGTAGLVVAGGMVIVALQAALAIGVYAALAGGMAITGFAAYKRLPGWIASIENRATEALQRERDRHVQQLQVDRNKHLAALKAEARKNPIEQLQNFLNGKSQLLAAFEKGVADIGAQVKSTVQMLEKRKKERPDRDYSQKDAAVTAMNDAYQYSLSMVEKGRTALVDLKEAVEDAKFDFQFSQAGQSAMQNLRALSGQDLMNEMLAAESFDSVRQNFNQVFSEIEVQIGKINTSKQLDYGQGVTIDISSLNIPTSLGGAHAVN